MSSCFWHLSPSIFITFGWSVPGSMSLKHNGFIPRWIQNAFNQVFAKCAPKFHISWARQHGLWEHYSTSLCRLIQWIFLSMDYVSECLFVQAGSSFSSRFSSSPMCCCLHVWQSGINAKNIFIFHHKWTKKKNQNDNFTYEFSDRKNLPLFKLSALLPEPSWPAPTGEAQQLFWAQKEKAWVAFSKENIASWFAPSPVCAGDSFITGWEVKKEKEASINCPYLLVL